MIGLRSHLALSLKAARLGLRFSSLLPVDFKKSPYWSTDLNLQSAAECVRKADSTILNAMKLDSTDIKQIEKKVNTFVTSDKICDRAALMDHLSQSSHKKGKFICLLGGKTFGKSKCIEALLHEANNREDKEVKSSEIKDRLVLLVDMRGQGNSSIIDGIFRALSEVNDKDVKTIALQVLKGGLKAAVSLSFAWFGLLFPSSLKDLWGKFAPKLTLEEKIKISEDLLQALSLERNVTVIIDEANKAFTFSLPQLDSGEVPENLKSILGERLLEAKEGLSLLTRLTKQKNMINVILASSEHAFPFRLKKLKYYSKDFSDLLIFNEVGPGDCYNLLTGEWGLGENLAVSLMNVYGGHIYNISNALNRLAISSTTFIAPMDPMASSDIVTILKRNGGYCKDGSVNKEAPVVKTLTSLAEKGFSELHELGESMEGESESLAELLSRLNIAGVITRSSIAPGLPRDIWNGTPYKFALIPSSQTMRLMIADELTTPLTSNK